MIRLLGDFDIAEEAVHEAFVAAVEQWPVEGVPSNPRAWLVSTGRFKAIDRLRRRAKYDVSLEDVVEQVEAIADPASASGEHEGVEDDRLRLICHLLPPDTTPAGVLLGSGKLATELDRLDLIDEYKFLVHPSIAGHGPTLYQSGLPSTRRLELVSAKPLRSGAVAMHYRRVSGVA